MHGSSIYEHFHVPVNAHNRFLSNAKESEKFFLRDVPRYPPYTTQPEKSKERPKSAPPPTWKLSEQYPELYAQLLRKKQLETRLYPPNKLVNADLETGKIVSWDEKGPNYARVLTHDMPLHKNVTKGLMRQPHENYHHYRKFGFAGKGAKTSWASSPKNRQRVSNQN